MKLLHCWLLAALSVCGAVASAPGHYAQDADDWSFSTEAFGADSDYSEGTVHARGADDVKQSSPTIGAEATLSPSPEVPATPKVTPKSTTPNVTPKSTTPNVTPKPTTAKPATATPSAAKPVTAKPVTTKPTTAKPTTAKPTTAKPAATRTPAPAADASDSSDAGSSDTGAASTSTSDFLQPFSTKAPSETLFKRNAGLIKMAPIVNLAADIVTKNERPIPTNKWWGNLIHSTVKDSATIADPAWSNPYAIKLPVKAAPYGLQVSYSYTHRIKAPVKDGKIKFYLHEFHNDLTLSAEEFAAKPSYEIYDWSDLGASLRICTGAGGAAQTGKCLESSVVNGMAFISAKYDGLTPKLVSEYAVTKLTKGESGKYIVELDNKQKWVLYTSTAATFKIDATGKAIAAAAAYTGSLRIAVLPEGASVDIYDEFAACTVLGGAISIESRTKYAFNWAVDGASCDNKGLLHFAFQHQIDSMGAKAKSANSTGTITLQSTVRGAMAGQVTLKSAAAKTIQWTLTEPEMAEDIDFYPPRKPSAAAATQIKAELKKDIASEWTLAKDGSYYFNGKAYQKYASLCLMAADASVVGTDTTLKATCVKKLEALIEPFLTNTWASPLVYETSYRGIVTNLVFTTNDVNVEFGNGVYNDHHYHYGYWVTASAMLRKLDPTWSRMLELEEMVTTLLRDVANPSPADKFFPTFRHFSWFLGHSYSHGVTPMADGKDQESTSEDINFYYGMMLWGKVSGKKAVEDLGSLMLRIDARAVRTYFLMDSDNALHPPEFVRNHVTGIFFDGKVDYATWFSPEKYCIHGIQMIPVSPINEIVRSAKFIQQEWDDILAKESIVVDAASVDPWLSLLYVNYATINKAAALERLATVKMDDGLTRSWAMYNAATRANGGSGGAAQTPTGAPKATPAPVASSTARGSSSDEAY